MRFSKDDPPDPVGEPLRTGELPRISVIIPLYNGEKTIEETIRSALGQTFKDTELLIIDDGSKDDSLKIAKSLGDRRIAVYSRPHSGMAAARNRGLDLARGEFVAFLDHDDLWAPDKLEKQLSALEADPESVLAYSDVIEIDEAGRYLRPGYYRNLAYRRGIGCHEKLLKSNFLQTCSNPLIRRKALTAAGAFDSFFAPADDWDLFLRLAERYSFKHVPSEQVYYRISHRQFLLGRRLGMSLAVYKVIYKHIAGSKVRSQGPGFGFFHGLYARLLSLYSFLGYKVTHFVNRRAFP